VKLLLVNGNRTQAVTDIVMAEASRIASASTTLMGVTASFGADIVYSHAEYVIAAHATLDALARHHGSYDMAVIAVSFDCGLAAARELLTVPVLGITESARLTACKLGEKVGVITFGDVSDSLYDDVIARNGLSSRVTARRTIGIASTREYLSATQRDARVAREANSLASAGADVVVICGAAMAGIGHRLRSVVTVPIVDGVCAAVQDAEALARDGYPPNRRRGSPRAAMTGISPELAALFAQP
jgi:Asp/Glu/hydantoin racemase